MTKKININNLSITIKTSPQEEDFISLTGYGEVEEY